MTQQVIDTQELPETKTCDSVAQSDGRKGRRKRARTYSRHGLNALKARVKVRGLNGIDMRTAGAQDLVLKKNEWIKELGGHRSHANEGDVPDVSFCERCVSAVPAQKKDIIEEASISLLILRHIDAWLLEQKSLVNFRKRSVPPIVLQRQQLADAFFRCLTILGLEGEAKEQVMDLAEHWKQKDGDGDGA